MVELVKTRRPVLHSGPHARGGAVAPDEARALGGGTRHRLSLPAPPPAEEEAGMPAPRTSRNNFRTTPLSMIAALKGETETGDFGHGVVDHILSERTLQMVPIARLRVILKMAGEFFEGQG